MPTGRRSTEARNLHKLFRAVEQTTASIAASGTVSATPPAGTAGKVFQVPSVSGGSVSASDLYISDVTITNGEITSVEITNANASAQTADIVWTFTGFF